MLASLQISSSLFVDISDGQLTGNFLPSTKHQAKGLKIWAYGYLDIWQSRRRILPHVVFITQSTLRVSCSIQMTYPKNQGITLMLQNTYIIHCFVHYLKEVKNMHNDVKCMLLKIWKSESSQNPVVFNKEKKTRARRKRQLQQIE